MMKGRYAAYLDNEYMIITVSVGVLAMHAYLISDCLPCTPGRGRRCSVTLVNRTAVVSGHASAARV